jgi:hypothetical protein
MTTLTSPDGEDTLEVAHPAGVRALKALGWEADESEPEAKPKAAKKTAAAPKD